MPSFQYIASTNKGESVRGALNANDKSDLAKKLQEKGLFLVSCRSDAPALMPSLPSGSRGGNGSANATMIPAPSASAAASWQPNPNASSSAPSMEPSSIPQSNQWFANLFKQQNGASKGTPRGKVNLKELVVLTRQISISINAGMSFVEALQSLAANTRNPRLSYVLRLVLEDILSGKKFSDALAAHPDIFRPVYVSMAAAGEAGGFMPEALNRTAEFLEKEIELRSKIKSAMVYPSVIAVVASVVVIGMMVFIVPTFVKVFQDMHAPLPLPTRLLIQASDFTRHGGFMLPVFVFGGVLLLQRLRKTNEKIRTFYDEHVLSVPLFGKLVTLEIITRFIRTLSSLVANGVMALQALSVARQVVENRSIERVVDEIFSSVQQGNGISPVLYRSKYFPVLVANMVSTGEKTGSIPEVLNKMADYYDAEVSSAIRDLLTMMEPLLIVVMAVIVGFVIAGLMLPTFQMSSLVG
jgi:type IV pilus assembly protein PilC